VQSLKNYASPVLGSLPVRAIDTALVMQCLEPIWRVKPETASRVRGRIEAVLDWATVREFRIGANPARWRGHLDKLLPGPRKVRPVKHLAALPYEDIPQFMVALRQRQGIAARCLEFAVLTAARTGEAIGARWDEIDLQRGIRTIPSNRMKSDREHRVPLPPAARELLQKLNEREGEFVFSAKMGRPLSVMAMLKLLSVMGHTGITVHGFRSSFRDWAAEQTAFPHEVCEQALAHSVGNAVERAYKRTDLFEKRRKLMEAWANYCVGGVVS
jgi:integrase